MLSGNGRHRRPRQVPALIVAAGVTGSAIAIPLLGAGSASAADTATWNRVADCESGGDWSANLGNGYYGGLQMSQEIWEAYGGTAYAPRADLASPSEQISVAEMVLAAQGASAWQSCGSITGLGGGGSESTGTPSADPLGDVVKGPSFGDGADAVPEPDAGDPLPAGSRSGPGESASESPESPEPSGQSSSPAGSPQPAGSAEGSAGSAEASGEAGAEAGTGKHRGTPATEGDEAGNSGDDHESGRHASLGDGATRDGAVTGDEYVVRIGDNLSSIADANQVPGGWPALYEANQDVVGSDADLILPGQSLDLGPEKGQLKE
ncbi:LysM peptidoglycan-binding domain-containing protein [Streptomyces marianii]|uniref:LysM peptidoglycan-binding domain-containing protein n=1 Tax=Streptomyces marianii TaxID=1817406 RepID=A0A5R9E649_9ACTN|nr:transglycosylase family protein [Streptomyces marianii]TLQ45481.1 LysM peptidoglycan-binding domain-containing protein [Streptomyces marianii]